MVILLVSSMIYNYYQFNIINDYKNELIGIDSDTKTLILHLSNSLKNNEFKDIDLRYLSSVSGSVFFLSRWASSYNFKLNYDNELVDYFTYLNNVFIIGDIKVINKYSEDLSNILNMLYEKPNDKPTIEKFKSLVMQMLNESKKE